MERKYPPCGRLCEACDTKKKGICPGCEIVKGKPFFIKKEKKKEICPIFECAEKHRVEHCGQCPEFPCQKLLSWYDPRHGIRSALAYIGLLTMRKKFGIKEWKKWVKIYKKEERKDEN